MKYIFAALTIFLLSTNVASARRIPCLDSIGSACGGGGNPPHLPPTVVMDVPHESNPSDPVTAPSFTARIDQKMSFNNPLTRPLYLDNLSPSAGAKTNAQINAVNNERVNNLMNTRGIDDNLSH